MNAGPLTARQFVFGRAADPSAVRAPIGPRRGVSGAGIGTLSCRGLRRVGLAGLVVAVEVLLNGTVDDFRPVATDRLGMNVNAVKQRLDEPQCDLLFGDLGGHSSEYALSVDSVQVFLDMVCVVYTLSDDSHPADWPLVRVVELGSPMRADWCLMMDDHDRLWARVEWIGDHVAAAFPPTADVFKAFDRVTDGVGDDPSDRPALPVLHAALAAFDGLPAAEQRRVMNGWKATRDCPTVADVMEPESGAVVFRYRSIIKSLRGPCRTFTLPVWDAQACWPDAVRVLICEGTTQAQAVAALREALAVVLNQWGDVTGDDEFGFEVKSGTPEAPNTPMLGGYAGGLKLAPTAA